MPLQSLTVTVNLLTCLVVENNPNGFPRLAAFQASDSNFGLYRSYSYLHSRILLDLQSEITELESELDNIDWDELEEDEDRPRYRLAESETGSEDGTRTRRVVLREIKVKLMEYGTFIHARTKHPTTKATRR